MSDHLNDIPLQERLTAPDFGPAQAISLKRLISVKPESRKEIRNLLASFDSTLASSLPQKEASDRHGAFLWAMGDLDKSQKTLAASKTPLAEFVLAAIACSNGQLSDAAAGFERASGNTDDGPLCLAHAAEIKLLQKDRDAAEALINKAGKGSSKSEHITFIKGLLAEDEGDHETALELYEAALAIDPHHAKSNFRSAWILDLRGMDDQAVVRYKLVAGESSLFANALTNLGLLHDEHDRFDEAITCFEEALKLQPTNERLRLYLSDAIASTEMYYDEAQEKEQERIELLLRTPLNDFELSVRSRNCLARLGVNSLSDLIKHTEEELLAHKNFGETSLQEIKDLLNAKGLYLGMGRDEERRRRQRARLGPVSDNPLLNQPISELGLSVRGRSCMQRLGIVSIGDLVAHSERELLGIKNFGQTSLRELRIKLGEMNLSFKDDKQIL
jgi:DNA-directed RNA polymerase subunit alpha